MGKTNTKTVILGIVIATVFILGILTIDFASADHPQNAGYRFTQFVEDLASHIPVTSADIVDGTITTGDLNLASVDARYANVAGDTFTGNLNVDGNLDVVGTITGDVSGVTLAGDTLITQNVGMQPILELRTTPAATAPPLLVTDSAANELFKVNQDGSIQIGSNTVVIGADGTVTGPLKLEQETTVGGVKIIAAFNSLDESILVLEKQFGAALDEVTVLFNGAISLLQNNIDALDSRVTLLELGGLTPATFYENSETFVNVPLDLVIFTAFLTVQCDAGDTVTGGGAKNNLFIFVDPIASASLSRDYPFPIDGTTIGWEAEVFPGCADGSVCITNAPNSFTLKVFCADTALPAHTP